MADNNFYPVEIPAEDAKQGISTGFEASRTAGILYGDGQGGIRTARPGEDYGYPLIQGNGPPGGSTVANLGQHYFDMAAAKPPYEYICVGYTAFGFVWTVYGDPGAGFQVLGRFSSLEALEAAVAEGLVPKPSPGDAYFVGDVAPYDMYFWDIMTLTWAYYGPLGGAGGSADVTGIPPHGDAGQVLKKLSDADYDVGWGDDYTLPLATEDVLGGVKSGGSIFVSAENGKMYLFNGVVARAKLAQDALYSPIVRLSNPETAVTLQHLGVTLASQWTSPSIDYLVTLDYSTAQSFPEGGDFALAWRDGLSVKLQINGNIRVGVAGKATWVTGCTLAIRKRFGTIALKRSHSDGQWDYWFAFGDMEVIT